MDIQRLENPYVSCIKIRGVPIIAPLMTDDLRMEMQYYRHLAIAVEEKLRNLETAAKLESEITPENDSSLKLESCETQNLKKIDKPSETIVDITKDISSIENSLKPSENTTTISWKSSDDETSFINESSDIVSTDVNSYTNENEVSSLDNNCKKPKVPKTLDIVPITVDNCVEKEIEIEKKCNSIDSSESHSPESEETPKLVRQGSYVLDTPSPMLLAHLHEEMSNYVPSKGNTTFKRREWNLSEAKSEWELHRKKDIVTNTSRTIARMRRNSASSAINQSKINNRVSQRVAKSVDCIQSALNIENNTKIFKSPYKINGHAKNSKSTNNGSNNRRNNGNISILKLANKIGGSLGNLNNVGTRNVKRTQNKITNERMTKSFDSSETPRNKEINQGSTQKSMSSVTSEKLVHVFKEIQNTHERQMMELITRQRREQEIMQKEFEKQQILLLSKMEKTFPGISLKRLVEKISPVQSPYFKREKKIIVSTKIPDTNGLHLNNDNNHDDYKCPLDDIYPREEFCESSPYHIKQSQSTRTYVIEQKSPPIGLYSTSVLNSQRKNSTVSRQLFPLDGKTRHVPVPNRTIYQEQHVKSATIITAYVRGYLVRRLLQTDRVIALKTTYKEALHCMLKLHVDAPLALPELNFHQRLQLQCDAASMNIVELFAQEPSTRMEIIRQDRQIKRARHERPNSARSYSFATQRTLARKKLKEMGDFETPSGSRTTTLRSRCQTWASIAREKRAPNLLNQGIKRSTSAGAVRKPWR